MVTCLESERDQRFSNVGMSKKKFTVARLLTFGNFEILVSFDKVRSVWILIFEAWGAWNLTKNSQPRPKVDLQRYRWDKIQYVFTLGEECFQHCRETRTKWAMVLTVLLTPIVLSRGLVGEQPAKCDPVTRWSIKQTNPWTSLNRSRHKFKICKHKLGQPLSINLSANQPRERFSARTNSSNQKASGERTNERTLIFQQQRAPFNCNLAL